MKFGQHDKYPRCGALIRNYLCMIDVASPKVFEAFVDVCESEKWARRAITWGRNPTVFIAKFVNQNGGEQPTPPGMYKGHCTWRERNIVNLNRHWAIGYEEFRDNWIHVERIVLHELIHWARFMGGKPGHANGTREAGNFFEEKAYGGILGDHDDLPCS